MKGDMRDFIFNPSCGFLALDYFQKIGIRKERFGRQEVAAQILININQFIDFFIKFLKTKKLQIGKGLDIDKPYREILSFQTSRTQSPGEKTSIQKRHDFWKDYFSNQTQS